METIPKKRENTEDENILPSQFIYLFIYLFRPWLTNLETSK